jgi:hypothetical protein
METDNLTADDLYKAIMSVWARRAREDGVDKSQMDPQPDLSGNLAEEQGI